MSFLLNTSLRAASVAALIFLLTACGTVFDNDKINYKSQTEEKVLPLEVPPDLTKISRSKRYEMPDGSVSANNLNNDKSPADNGTPTSPLVVGDIHVKREGQQMCLEVA